jgi:hypothetical protein
LSEEIIRQNGSYSLRRRWYRDWHPEMKNAVLTKGWTGRETKVEETVIKPIKTFMVKE